MNESLLEAYPLTWPDGQARTPASRRIQARFEAGFAQSRDELMAELGRLVAAADALDGGKDSK